MERYEQPFAISSDCVTAFYKLLNNGSLSVLNQGVFLENGTKTAAEGMGVLSIGKSQAFVGEMKVSFGSSE
jgi:lipocalin